MPTGITIASTDIIAPLGKVVLGSFYSLDADTFGAGTLFENAAGKAFGAVTANGASLAGVYMASGGASLNIAALNGNALFTNGDAVVMDFIIPVFGWNG